jgi:prepilin-type N-terminal cleavage/methylation domain-containing protein
MKHTKRAFTLIELLVVIAIIAILAAILFPVFAQAKESAKKTAALSGTKQLATSLAIYQADHDDYFPFAFSQRTDGTWRHSTVHPVPNGTVVGTGWDVQPVLAENQAFWANSIQPYVKNYDLYGNPGQQDAAIAGESFSTSIRPAMMGMTFNGLLHTYSGTAIENPSIVPSIWTGTGNMKLKGRGSANPSLRCTVTTREPCVFNPGGAHQPSLAAGANHSLFFGYGNFYSGYKVWAYTQGVLMARTDSSAKFYRVGTRIGTDPNTEFTDPFTDPYHLIQASPPATTLGGSWWYNTCSTGDAVATSAAQPRYICFFRPDRTK